MSLSPQIIKKKIMQGIFRKQILIGIHYNTKIKTIQHLMTYFLMYSTVYVLNWSALSFCILKQEAWGVRQSGKTFSSAEESIPGKCSISCNFSSKSWVGICHWRVWFLDTEHWKKKISKYHSPANLWGFTYLISSKLQAFLQTTFGEGILSVYTRI